MNTQIFYDLGSSNYVSKDWVEVSSSEYNRSNGNITGIYLTTIGINSNPVKTINNKIHIREVSDVITFVDLKTLSEVDIDNMNTYYYCSTIDGKYYKSKKPASLIRHNALDKTDTVSYKSSWNQYFEVKSVYEAGFIIGEKELDVVPGKSRVNNLIIKTIIYPGDTLVYRPGTDDLASEDINSKSNPFLYGLLKILIKQE